MFCECCGRFGGGYYCPGSGYDRYQEAAQKVAAEESRLPAAAREALAEAVDLYRTNRQRDEAFARAVEAAAGLPIQREIQKMRDHFDKRGQLMDWQPPPKKTRP